MTEKKSYPEEIFEWRLNKYKGRVRTKLPHQEQRETANRVNRLVDRGINGLRFPDDFVIPSDNGDKDSRGVPANLFDVAFEYNDVTNRAMIKGSGGAVVLDDSNCMVDVARYFIDFIQPESCGDCTFCRVGTKRMQEILHRICNGQGKLDELDMLYDLALTIKETTLCEVGKIAANPVLGTLRHFRADYEAHIQDHTCRAGTCELDSKAVK